MCEFKSSTGNWDTGPVYQCTPCVESVMEQIHEGPEQVMVKQVGETRAKETANGACLEAYRWYRELKDPDKKPEQYYQRAYETFGPRLKSTHRSHLEWKSDWEEIGHFFKGIGLMWKDADSFLDRAAESLDVYLFGPREYLVAPPPALYAFDTMFA